MIQAIDSSLIQRWRERVSNESLPEGHEDDARSDTEVDEWEATSVEISDTASMVAQGRAKRRIEKWRAYCDSIVVGGAM